MSIVISQEEVDRNTYKVESILLGKNSVKLDNLVFVARHLVLGGH